MNFFKSVFSDDPDPKSQTSLSNSSSQESENNEDQYTVPNIPTSPMNFFKSIFTDDDPGPKTQQSDSNEDDPDHDSSPIAQNQSSGQTPMNFFKSIFTDDDPGPKTQQSDSNEDDPDHDSSPIAQNQSSGQTPMNFFKSIFSDDPDPKTEAYGSDSPGNQDDEANEDDPDEAYSPNDQEKNNPNLFGGWNFGGLVQTLANKSESVIETYRRDLKEFGSGLKEETKVIRDVASRAVKELPTSIEAGASKAQGSIETVWKGTAQIISQGKEALLPIDQESDSSDTQNYSSRDSYNSKQYSRFDARVRKIQGELSTFRDDPEDSDDYQKWKVGFLLEEKGEELERLFEENEDMEEVYNIIVPDEIDHETFWVRYFYKVYKLELADDARAKLLKRAISVEDDEDLSWDVDDDDDNVNDDIDKLPAKLTGEIENREPSSDNLKSVLKEENSVDDIEEKDEEKTRVIAKVDLIEKDEVDETDSMQIMEGNSDESQIDKPAAIDEKKEDNLTIADHESKNIIVGVDSSIENVPNEKSQVDAISESKSDRDDSSKDSSFTVVSNQPSMAEEEDLGWDEIEDLGSGDEKKPSPGGSPSKVDFRKRLTAAEEEEDLSWDIEDDDEPIKA